MELSSAVRVSFMGRESLKSNTLHFLLLQSNSDIKWTLITGSETNVFIQVGEKFTFLQVQQ